MAESRVSLSTSGNFSFCSLSNSSNSCSLALALASAMSRLICKCSSAACRLTFSFIKERSVINLATLAFCFIQANCKGHYERDERDLADLLIIFLNDRLFLFCTQEFS